MKPLTISQLKDQLLAIMRLMVANEGLYLDVSYKGRLYRINIEDLKTELVVRRRPRRKSLVESVKAQKCPQCKKLMLNNVCMSSLCGSAKAV